jgi:hypothetical protein
METFKDFLSKQIESAAYHEAGHMTAAVLQAMPVRAGGLYVDLRGCGVANYFDHSEADSAATPDDMRERKLTIIALFAAHAAQTRFYRECDQSGWDRDRARIKILSARIYSADEEARTEICNELWKRATELIDKHWPIVEELAKALLAKPCIPMPPEESAVGWGNGQVRHLSGSEVVDFFAGHGIAAKVVNDGTKYYDSTQDVPHYDSLASAEALIRRP